MHLLVYWPSENSYSAVAEKKIKLFNLDNTPVDSKDIQAVIGCLLRVEYGSGSSFNGKLLNAGSKQDMRNEENRLSNEAAEKSFEARQNVISTPAETSSEFVTPKSTKRVAVNDVERDAKSRRRISDQLDPVDFSAEQEQKEETENGQDVDTSGNSDRMNELEEENRQLKRHISKMERIIRTKKSLAAMDTTVMIDFGSGAKIAQNVVDWAKLTCGGNASIFLRKLMFHGGIFSLEEIANSSMTGKRAPLHANAKPALNSTKFKALKDYVITSFGLGSNPYQMLLFEKRIVHICTDARKKLKPKASDGSQ